MWNDLTVDNTLVRMKSRIIIPKACQKDILLKLNSHIRESLRQRYVREIPFTGLELIMKSI
uniref:Uncharacterized protein n=1 Tax=Lepeophtheirus salmonis TaxID=72036 RepID=A0A0K2TBG8_LEPSM